MAIPGSNFKGIILISGQRFLEGQLWELAGLAELALRFKLQARILDEIQLSRLPLHF
jgi:hypothetical protein